MHPWGKEAAAAYGRLRAQQEAMGKPLGPLVMQIAADAVALGAVLVTNDQGFHHVPDLRRFKKHIFILLRRGAANLPFELAGLALSKPGTANEPFVVWLSPVGANGQTDASLRPGVDKSFQTVQKDRMFQPHLLVVPVGSLVAFPNRDPFFHNVFSLYNGRRFDLGPYETGASHSVPFNERGFHIPSAISTLTWDR